MPFVKLDCAMLNSSIWWEKTQRDIFITALLMAEPFEVREPMPQIHIDSLEFTGWKVPPGWYGFLGAASIAIIHRTMVEREEGLTALIALGSPDPDSKSKAYEGRRMVRVDGGFLILNFIAYRDRDHTAAERSRRWRERQKGNPDPSKKPSKKKPPTAYTPRHEIAPKEEQHAGSFEQWQARAETNGRSPHGAPDSAPSGPSESTSAPEVGESPFRK